MPIDCTRKDEGTVHLQCGELCHFHKNIIYLNFVDCLLFISSWYLYFILTYVEMNVKQVSKICFWGKCKVLYNCKCTVASSFWGRLIGRSANVTHNTSQFWISDITYYLYCNLLEWYDCSSALCILVSLAPICSQLVLASGYVFLVVWSK